MKTAYAAGNRNNISNNISKYKHKEAHKKTNPICLNDGFYFFDAHFSPRTHVNMRQNVTLIRI